MTRHAIFLLALAATPAWSQPAASAQIELDSWRLSLRQQGCSSVEISDGKIVANCPGQYGGAAESRIDASQCKGMDLALYNGRLVCATKPADEKPREPKR